MSTVRIQIESTFIGGLIDAKLYGEPKEGLLDELCKRVNEATEEGLRSAVDRIIRNRNSGAFPKFPECFEAIRATEVKRRNVGRASREPVTAQNYANMCSEHGQRMGYRKGEWPVINLEKNPDQWDVWIKYYERVGMRGAASLMMQPGQRTWTVPAFWPDEFDGSFMRIAA